MGQDSFRKRIIVDVSLQEHQEIKARAAKKFVPMRLYIMQAIERQIMEEKQYEEEDVYNPRRAIKLK